MAWSGRQTPCHATILLRELPLEFHNGKNWERPCVVHDLTDLSLLEQSQRSFQILANFACRTPSFADQLIEADNGLGEVMKPPEKSFWAKYVSNCTKYLLHFVQYLAQYLLYIVFL